MVDTGTSASVAVLANRQATPYQTFYKHKHAVCMRCTSQNFSAAGDWTTQQQTLQSACHMAEAYLPCFLFVDMNQVDNASRQHTRPCEH